MNEFLAIRNFLSNFSHNSLYIRVTTSIVLLIGFLISHRLLSRLMIKLVSRIEIKHTRIDSTHFDALQKPFNHLFLLTGFYFALAVSPLVIYSSVTTESFWFIQIPISIIPFKLLNKFYFALVSAYVTWIIYLIAHIYEELLNSLKIKFPFMDNSLFLRFTARIIRAAIVVIGAFVSLSLLFEGLPSILTGVGLGGAALAFIAKDALSNIFSGMVLMFDKPFVIGDWIEIIGLEGVVEDISFRSTRLRTFTQGQVVIPNAQISNANLINWTRMEKRRVKFDLGVSYNTSIDNLNTCIKKIKNILLEDPDVENDTYIVVFENFGDYALNIQILYYSMHTDYASYLQVKQRINMEILKLCEHIGVDIAFPTQTLYMQRTPKTPVKSGEVLTAQ